MNLFKNILSLLIIIAIICFYSCNKDNEPLVYNSDLVFPNSIKINVEPYRYFSIDSSQSFWILGDSALVADTVNSQPEFQWERPLTNISTVVISEEKFVVEDHKLLNADRIIWQWQPGMGAKEPGKVAYNEGKPVQNKKILYDTQPLPLESGLYFWAVWGWDNEGRNIIFSSKALKIYID